MLFSFFPANAGQAGEKRGTGRRAQPHTAGEKSNGHIYNHLSTKSIKR
ncbi:hypothetical protein M076_2373 [Bacteroides fragilis str. 2-F-2 |uniref:Uncharacterized protein n=1 Tax=Bacteroides fragilis str. 2-F-2 \|nr:hypothetical protein M077_5210 [Bacteroides fragilis str. 2-F-2 \